MKLKLWHGFMNLVILFPIYLYFSGYDRMQPNTP